MSTTNGKYKLDQSAKSAYKDCKLSTLFKYASSTTHSTFTEQDQMQLHIVQHLLLLESFYEKERTEIILNRH